MFKKHLPLMASEGGDPTSGAGGNPPANPPVDPKPPADPQPPARSGERVHSLLDKDFKRIKEEAAAKGSRLALENMAKELGFKTPDEVKAFVAKAKQKPGKPREERRPQGQGQSQGQQPNDRNAQKFAKQLEDEKRTRIQAQKKARQVEAELARVQAQAELEKTLIRHGASDIDFVRHSLESHLSGLVRGKPPEEAEKITAAFDEEAWLGDLKKAKPYLFGGAVVTQPANTGPTNPGPGAPKPGEVNKHGANGVVDALKMNPQEWAEYRRSLKVAHN